jgi:Tol biopolymer transport system component
MNKKIKIIIIVILVCIVGTVLIRSINKPTVDYPVGEDEVFGIYTASLDGTGMTKLLTDSYRQMILAHVSPNKEWITFTRFNNIIKDGCATVEKSGFINTEIMVMKTDGTTIKTLRGPDEGQLNTNSYWVNDSNILYLHTPNKSGKTEIRRLTLDDKMNVISDVKVPVSENMTPVEPYQFGNKITFPGIMKPEMIPGIWIMNEDGTDLQQLTFPGPKIKGENDQHVSPDWKQLAFMRLIDGHWHTFVMDIDKPGTEQDISAQYTGNNKHMGLPHWIDNEKLVVEYLDFSNIFDLKKEIYTINQDGSNLEKIPLPSGYFYTQPDYFEGSDGSAKIIFSTKKIGKQCHK